MPSLKGFKEYLGADYAASIFDETVGNGNTYVIHCHEHRIYSARFIENLKYEVKIMTQGGEEIILKKIVIKMIYPVEHAGAFTHLIKEDESVKNMRLGYYDAPSKRRHIKNKTVYVQMKERQVLLFTLLEGEIIRGIIDKFSKYEIVIHCKGGIPVVILRHAVYDVRDKKGRCYLKSFQQLHKDWQKSELYQEISLKEHDFRIAGGYIAFVDTVEAPRGVQCDL